MRSEQEIRQELERAKSGMRQNDMVMHNAYPNSHIVGYVLQWVLGEREFPPSKERQWT